MFNIYDGPAYQDGNAYLNIPASDCSSAADCMYFGTIGVRRYPGTEKGYLPNAAIGWKQSNGFYYPPAFRSQGLFFNKVDIRHYVIEPIMDRGTYLTNKTDTDKAFIGIKPETTNVFSTYTDIDRQTELNDDDGTLTGFTTTVSVNEDPFFGAPIQASECKSNVGVDPASACADGATSNTTPPSARTSPYDYVTTVVYPLCAT